MLLSRTALMALVPMLILSGCLPGSGGVTPPSDQFFFPTAASLTPDGNYLAIANSNFDLAYSNGTVVLLDLDKIENELTSGCPEEGCEPVDEAEYILVQDTIRTGSYASFLTTPPDGDRLYMTVRGDTTLTWMKTDMDAEPGKKLTCFDPDSPPRGRYCDSNHRVSSGLPADPSALTVHRESYTLVDEHGDPVGETVVDWIYVTHLTSGSVSVFGAEVEEETDRGLPPELILVSEAFPQGVASVQVHPLTGTTFYAATRHSTSMYTFSFTSDPVDYDNATRIVMGPTVNLASAITDGYDSRDMAFSADGELLYVTNRSPNSLLIIDTSLNEWGWPSNRIVGVAELDVGPSIVTTYSPEGWDREWVYATCYYTDRVYVIDPELRQTVDVILTGNGPHVMVTDTVRSRGYLVNFIEGTISVIDLDPASSTFHEVRATVGIPEKVRSND